MINYFSVNCHRKQYHPHSMQKKLTCQPVKQKNVIQLTNKYTPTRLVNMHADITVNV
jgi:hypothetical protein